MGKTTTAINLGAALAFRGLKTLLIDLDPQANSTMSYVDLRGIDRSLYDVLAEDNCPLLDIVRPDDACRTCRWCRRASASRSSRRGWWARWTPTTG